MTRPTHSWKPLAIAAAVATLAVPAAWGAVDSELLGLMPADARAIAGVKVQEAQASAFGQFLLTQIGQQAGLDRLVEATGFDPRTDLIEIVAASTGEPGNGVVAASGVFQPTRLTNLATTFGASTHVYRGITVLTGKSQEPQQDGEEGHTDPPFSIAFLDASTVVVANDSGIEAVIDRWISGASATSELAGQAVDASANTHAWSVTEGLAQLHLERLEGAPTELAGLQNLIASIMGTSGGLTFTDTAITAAGEVRTDTPENAQAMVDVLTFLAAMQKEVPLTGQVSFTAEGSTVQINLTVTEEQAENLIGIKDNGTRAAVRRSRRR